VPNPPSAFDRLGAPYQPSTLHKPGARGLSGLLDQPIAPDPPRPLERAKPFDPSGTVDPPTPLERAKRSIRQALDPSGALHQPEALGPSGLLDQSSLLEPSGPLDFYLGPCSTVRPKE
jgi:hypothetical protein